MPEFTHSLDPFFHPTSIAVIGASATDGSVGSTIMHNLLRDPFGGVVYPVNPKRHSVHGVLCYPRLSDVPGAVDLAIVVTPAATVPAVVRECTERGVKAAIVISAGFSELGADGRALEQQVRDIARGKMRIVGPNCLGIIHPPSNLNASFATAMPRSGQVALLSQSGAILTAILDWALETQVGFSSFVSVGTAIDVDFAALIDYFGEDPQTRSIVLYMESIGDVRRFLSAARAVARRKPIIVVKAGRHEAGARAAASHTGALAGSDAVFDAAFRRAGVLRVQSIADLFNMSEILALQPQPAGPAMAIITNAGGPGVMATDELMLSGGALASLGKESLAALDAILPPYWSHANPVDVLGDAPPARYRKAVEICAADPGVQGLLVLLAPQAMTDPVETARELESVARSTHAAGKPMLASWLGGATARPGRTILNAAGVPTFDAPEEAIHAFLNMVQYRRNQELLYETPVAMPEDWAPDQTTIRRILQSVRGAGRTLLTEIEAKDVLNAAGIPVCPAVKATSAPGAVAAARQLGYPVVLKLYSEQITHKSDVGGVLLNLMDDDAVRSGFNRIQASLAALRSDVRFEGVTVQPMVRDKGHELIVGSSTDRQFGPVILFGAGGVLVEVFQDRVLALPPLNRSLARRLIERTHIYRALQGVRGEKSISFEKLETLLTRFSQLVVDFHDEIAEIDINPLLASAESIVALDARVVLYAAAVPAEKRPKLAIQPYPNHLTAPFQLTDDTRVTVRAIRPEDEPLIVAFHDSQSEHTIRMRFFGLVKRLTHENLVRLCHLDYDRELALVAVHAADEGPSQIMGVARYFLDPETRDAEFAIVVGDAWQGHGLGWHLMQRLIDAARQRGIRRLGGSVLRENTQMLMLVQELGFHVQATEEIDVMSAVLQL